MSDQLPFEKYFAGQLSKIDTRLQPIIKKLEEDYYESDLYDFSFDYNPGNSKTTFKVSSPYIKCEHLVVHADGKIDVVYSVPIDRDGSDDNIPAIEVVTGTYNEEDYSDFDVDDYEATTLFKRVVKCQRKYKTAEDIIEVVDEFYIW